MAPWAKWCSSLTRKHRVQLKHHLLAGFGHCRISSTFRVCDNVHCHIARHCWQQLSPLLR